MSEDDATAGDGASRYRLRLYVAGNSPRSHLAIETLIRVCETYLEGHADLEIIDVYEQVDKAKHEHVVGVPTVIMEWPRRRLVGDLSDDARVFRGLALHDLDLHEPKQ